jgi:hypothetical protein
VDEFVRGDDNMHLLGGSRRLQVVISVKISHKHVCEIV